MNHYLTGSEAGLSGYWQMNEGTSILVHDSSPNLNDGVILDPIWTHGKKISPISIDENKNTIECIKVVPNPCTNSLKISFSCRKMENVEINIFNIKGQKVKTLTNNAYQTGNHEVIWNFQDENEAHIASGLYFYSIKSEEKSAQFGKFLILE